MRGKRLRRLLRAEKADSNSNQVPPGPYMYLLPPHFRRF
jgi:hypothetical protein